MKKVTISINLLELQGACRATIKGRDCLVLKLDEARAKAHENGKIYLSLEVIERKDGEDKFNNTHFVAEPSTKQEREVGEKLPIIGNGKFFDSDAGRSSPAPRQHQRPARQEQRPAAQSSSMADDDWNDDSTIPF
jgi:hypothetical protein